VLISPEDLESLEETLAILGDTQEVAALREGLADLAEGRFEDLEQLKQETKA
jgi:PHD/YefM family antitoxin component YafN of YafNO toxin-antitoxin module